MHCWLNTTHESTIITVAKKVITLNQTLSHTDFIDIATQFQSDSENISLLRETEVEFFS